jgi:hypothetical protein
MQRRKAENLLLAVTMSAAVSIVALIVGAIFT